MLPNHLVEELFQATKVLEKKIECSVCLSNIEALPELSITRCGHRFHSQCLAQWFQSHDSCPLCRAALVRSADTLHRPQLPLLLHGLPLFDIDIWRSEHHRYGIHLFIGQPNITAALNYAQMYHDTFDNIGSLADITQLFEYQRAHRYSKALINLNPNLVSNFRRTQCREIMQIFYNCRSHKINVMLAMSGQDAVKIPPSIRVNIDYVYLTNNGMSDTELNYIYTKYAGMYQSFQAFKDAFQACTDSDAAMILDQFNDGPVVVFQLSNRYIASRVTAPEEFGHTYDSSP